MLVIENEKLAAEIIRKMLQNGNPIYESINVLVDYGDPINWVGKPSEIEEFPIRRYKISIQWSKSKSLIEQIKNLKVAFPIVKIKSNQELLEIAKTQDQWHFDTVYLDSLKKDELIHMGKDKQLNIIIETDNLKESF